MSTKVPYTPPTLDVNGFNCPFCHAFAKQEWGLPPRVCGTSNYGSTADFKICRCSRCGEFSVWIGGAIVYPYSSAVPEPNGDLQQSTQDDYNEARRIVNESPRGAAALLRLAIQKTCRQLGEPGENINTDIAALVKKGLPIPIQQALDIVRVVGNNAVHPGQIDLRDDPSTANRLFELVNLIAEVMLSQPKQVQALYDSIVPENLRKAIDERDGRPG